MKNLVFILLLLIFNAGFAQSPDTKEFSDVCSKHYENALSNIQAENYKEAEEYLLLAIENSADSIETSRYYYTLSMVDFQQKQPEECKGNALKALDFNPANGKAYIIIGKAYVTFSKDYGCFKETVEESVVFCAAVDKLIQAKTVDTTLTKEANELIDVYSNYFPDCNDFWQTDIENKKHFIECWIQEETVIRCRK